MDLLNPNIRDTLDFIRNRKEYESKEYKTKIVKKDTMSKKNPRRGRRYKNKIELYKNIMGIENIDDCYIVIYKLNFESKKSYIGLSFDYYKNRFMKHLALLNGLEVDKYAGEKINDAIKNDKLENVEILIKFYLLEDQKLGLSDVENMFKLENYYIRKYDTIDNGYNSIYNNIESCAKNFYNGFLPHSRRI